MLGMAKTKEQDTAGIGKDNVLGNRKDDSVKEERDMPSKKRHKLHKGDAAHAQLTEDGNSEAHLPIYGERESVAGRKVEEEAFVKAQDDGNSEAHLPIYGERESVAGRKVEEEAFVKAQDEGAN